MRPARGPAPDRLRQGRADPRRGARATCPSRSSSRSATPSRERRRGVRRDGTARGLRRRRRRCSREAGAEAVVIGTPHPLHAEPAIRAAEAGVHVLVEKPMAASLGGLRRHARRGAARPASTLGVISQRRFYEPVRRMKEAIDAGKIGTPGRWASSRCTAGATRPTTGPTPGAASGTPRAAACSSTSRPTSSTCSSGSWATVEEVSGYWANLNHPDDRGRGHRRRDPPLPRAAGSGSIVDEPVAEAGHLHQGPRPRVQRRLGRRRDRPRRDVHRRHDRRSPSRR